jgi:hypothetical protein
MPAPANLVAHRLFGNGQIMRADTGPGKRWHAQGIGKVLLGGTDMADSSLLVEDSDFHRQSCEGDVHHM